MRILDTGHCVEVLRGRLDLQGRIAPDEPHGLFLVTHNRQHFERISGLQIEDWL